MREKCKFPQSISDKWEAERNLGCPEEDERFVDGVRGEFDTRQRAAAADGGIFTAL